MTNFDFELGMEAEDVVTGLTGIITAKVEYLTGCIQFCLKPKGIKPDGDTKEGHYIDENQLRYIGEGLRGVIKPYRLNEDDIQPTSPGGPQADEPHS